MDCGVEKFLHLEEEERHDDTYYQSQQGDDLCARSNRRATAEWLLYDADVCFRDSKLKGSFLALIKQIGIKCLLDCLLSCDIYDLLLLLRHSRKIAHKTGFFLFCLVHLQPEACAIAFEGSEDGSSHLLEVGVEVHNGRTVLGSIFCQTIALQHHLIVVTNLSSNAYIAYSTHRWDKIVVRHILADIVHEILYHRVLRLGLNSTLASGVALINESIATCFDIDQTIVLLELGHLSFDITQLGMDKAYPILNELRSTLSNLILIVNDAALISLEQATKNIVSSLNVRIGTCDANQGALLVYLSTAYLII